MQIYAWSTLHQLDYTVSHLSVKLHKVRRLRYDVYELLVLEFVCIVDTKH